MPPEDEMAALTGSLDPLLQEENEDQVSQQSSENHHTAGKPHESCEPHVKRLVTVEPVVLLVIWLAMSHFVTTQYVYNRVSHSQNYTSYSAKRGSKCDRNASQIDASLQRQVQEIATLYNMLNTGASLLPVIAVSLFVGSYTDKAGRKYGMVPQLLSSMMGSALNVAIVAANLPLYCFILANVIGGLTGGEHCFIMTCFAYIADVTSSQQRTLRMYVLQTIILIGITGSVLGQSYLVIYIGFLNTYICILTMYVPVILYIICILPESVNTTTEARLFSLDHFRGIAKLYGTKSTATLKLILCVSITVISHVCIAGISGTIFLYFLNRPFCWSSIYVSLFCGYTLAVLVVGGIVVIPLTRKCLLDEGRMLLGSISGILFFTGIGIAPDTTFAFSVPPIGAAMSLVSPIGRSAATKIVSPSQQGMLQATITPLEQISMFVANFVNHALYKESLHVLRGLQYFASAFTMLIVSFLIGLLIFVNRKEQKKLERETIHHDPQPVKGDNEEYT